MKDKKTTYGIIGNPLKHSLSPLMQNAAFEALDVDAQYKLFEIQEDELQDFFDKLRQPDCGIFGLNVTIPYKEAVIPFLDALTPLAERLMAVNTIVVSHDRKLTGHNTDAPGFVSHLVELQFNTRDKNIAILGAGGSARAILGVLCLLPERPNGIKLYNRTASRAHDLVAELGQRIDLSMVDVVHAVDDLNLNEADMLINTTSVGLRADDPCLVSREDLHPGMLVYDLIYNPARTPLLKLAREQGAMTANGLGLLYYQGVLALQHWANTEIDPRVKAVMRRKLEESAPHV